MTLKFAAFCFCFDLPKFALFNSWLLPKLASFCKQNIVNFPLLSSLRSPCFKWDFLCVFSTLCSSLKVPTLKEGIGNANEVSQKLNELNQALEKEINEAFDSLVNMINDRRNELLSRLRNVESCKQATLAKQKDELENSLADLYTSCEFVEKALTHGSETEILLVKKQVEERLLEYGQMQVVTTPAENSYLVFEKGKKIEML